jgi:hypothetical protein
MWGSQSWLQPAFSRLSSPCDKSVYEGRDAPEETILSLRENPLRSAREVQKLSLVKNAG